MTIETINVHPRYKALCARRYLGQKDFPNVVRCTRRGQKLEPIPKGFEVMGSSELGYQVNLTTVLSIRTGDWVISAPEGLPLPDPIIMSDAEFQKHYIQE